MNTHERAAMQRALELMDAGSYIPAMRVLREALQPNREGKYYYKDNACTADSADSPDCICWHDKALAEQACPNGCDTSNGRCDDCPDYVAEQAEQEPVAWYSVKGGFNTCGYGTALYAAPVRTVDLTDDEIRDAVSHPMTMMKLNDARAVIAKLKEKTNG